MLRNSVLKLEKQRASNKLTSGVLELTKVASTAFLSCLQLLFKLGSSPVPLGRQVPGRAQLLNSQPGLPCRGKTLALVALPFPGYAAHSCSHLVSQTLTQAHVITFT